PSLALSARVVEPHEPMCIQALGSELAVEALDERVVGWLARARKVERDVALVRPNVQVARDKFGAVIDTNGLRKTDEAARGFEHVDNVGATKLLTHIQRWAIAREGVDHSKN